MVGKYSKSIINAMVHNIRTCSYKLRKLFWGKVQTGKADALGFLRKWRCLGWWAWQGSPVHPATDVEDLPEYGSSVGFGWCCFFFLSIGSTSFIDPVFPHYSWLVGQQVQNCKGSSPALWMGQLIMTTGEYSGHVSRGQDWSRATAINCGRRVTFSMFMANFQQIFIRLLGCSPIAVAIKFGFRYS